MQYSYETKRKRNDTLYIKLVGPLRGKERICIDGETFKYRDQIKKLGRAFWDRNEKAWCFWDTERNREVVDAFIAGVNINNTRESDSGVADRKLIIEEWKIIKNDNEDNDLHKIKASILDLDAKITENQKNRIIIIDDDDDLDEIVEKTLRQKSNVQIQHTTFLSNIEGVEKKADEIYKEWFNILRKRSLPMKSYQYAMKYSFEKFTGNQSKSVVIIRDNNIMFNIDFVNSEIRLREALAYVMSRIHSSAGDIVVPKLLQKLVDALILPPINIHVSPSNDVDQWMNHTTPMMNYIRIDPKIVQRSLSIEQLAGENFLAHKKEIANMFWNRVNREVVDGQLKPIDIFYKRQSEFKSFSRGLSKKSAGFYSYHGRWILLNEDMVTSIDRMKEVLAHEICHQMQHEMVMINDDNIRKMKSHGREFLFYMNIMNQHHKKNPQQYPLITTRHTMFETFNLKRCRKCGIENQFINNPAICRRRPGGLVCGGPLDMIQKSKLPTFEVAMRFSKPTIQLEQLMEFLEPNHK
jgi:predicted SprT family Zn-dependent metalloprotease